MIFHNVIRVLYCATSCVSMMCVCVCLARLHSSRLITTRSPRAFGTRAAGDARRSKWPANTPHHLPSPSTPPLSIPVVTTPHMHVFPFAPYVIAHALSRRLPLPSCAWTCTRPYWLSPPLPPALTFIPATKSSDDVVSVVDVRLNVEVTQSVLTNPIGM